MVGFIKKDGDTVYFNQEGELIYYIPEYYFSSRNAVQHGEKVELLGVFNYAVFDKNGKSSKVRNFRFPSVFQCKPSSITKQANFHLTGTREASDYRFLHFKKGDELICSTRTVQSIDNVIQFMNVLTGGHLPETVPYDQIWEYIDENAKINGFSYGLPAQTLGMVATELCRSPEDARTPFRLTEMKNMTGYKNIGIKMVPKYISPYTAITSENADESIAVAMTNKGHKESPLERVMMD